MNGIYRGKRKDNEEWVEGFYFCMHHNDNRTHTHHFIIPIGIDIPKERPIGDIQVEIDPDTLCLCSELPDKKGQSIFSDDIIEIQFPCSKDIGVVSFSNCHFSVKLVEEGCIYDLYLLWREIKLKVIGSIHDNSESQVLPRKDDILHVGYSPHKAIESSASKEET